MATIVLQAAGSFLGGFLGPAGAAIGSAAGAMAGYVVDRRILDSTRHLHGARLERMQPFTAEEGAALPRLYGTARIGATLIWATRFEETATTTRQGGKGGPRTTEYDYHANAAFALCEGEIAGIRRIWADGRELDRDQYEMRIYKGSDTQPVDPLIEARQGTDNAPAYRGVAYVVFERFPLAEFGNRLPQFQFEVLRPVGRLHTQMRSIAMIPGSTEYGLSPSIVTRERVPGERQPLNRRVVHGTTDFIASLDELQALCPNLEEVALVVTWFGNDLRAGECLIRPAVANTDPDGLSRAWSVSGVGRTEAVEVSHVDGAAAYGGSPSDWTVVEAIREVRSRGLRVALYPFIMMDVPADNDLDDPYGNGAQPPYPWRGRITCDPAPGRQGSADKAQAARNQLASFTGRAAAGDFAVNGETVHYSGPAGDWGFRRLVLHYAHLSVAAGGVDFFLLGSEMRGVTGLRDGNNRFPFVETLCDLASDVHSILGDGTAISYGADWSEYFGHQPADGSGDVLFHLDPLWAHDAITAVGIDNYMPLADWRDEDFEHGNPDGFLEPHDARGLRSQVAAGEGYDWFYASMADRLDRVRTPITDGGYGKPWVYRYKDLKNWWSNPHFDRIGGVEQAESTAWVPRSKPIWLTELGCPAVDKGPNQPNVFPDPKSAESAVPYFSSGGRSDIAQHRFLEAHFDYWTAVDDEGALDARNPVSDSYNGRMLDVSRIYPWAWDARPIPAFPLDWDLWRDGDNWQTGHWLNGRLSGATVPDLIEAVLADHGIAADASAADGMMTGFVVQRPMSARAALESVCDLFSISAAERTGGLVFEAMRLARPAKMVTEMAVLPQEPVLGRERSNDDALPGEAELTFTDPFIDHQQAVARAVRAEGGNGRQETLSISGVLESGCAEALLGDWLERQWLGRETVSFALPASMAVDIEPGHLLTLPLFGDGNRYVVTEKETGVSARINARRATIAPARSWRRQAGRPFFNPPYIASRPHAVFADLPILAGDPPAQDQFRIAVHARPWRTQVVLSSPEETGFQQTVHVTRPAVLGRLTANVGPGFEGRIDASGQIEVQLYSGEVSSVSMAQFLAGANVAALRSASGEWEVFQFAEATETAPSQWRLSRLLRGQAGTGDAMASGAFAGADFVLLDERVVPAGLTRERIGLQLQWRVGPAGQSLSQADFASHQGAGGVRALTPLAPVHLRARREPSGDVAISWVRRSRIDADSWLAPEIPLGEETERYELEVGLPDGDRVRVVTTGEASWLYPAPQIMQDFGVMPARMAITVRQSSQRIGPGLTTSRIVTLD